MTTATIMRPGAQLADRLGLTILGEEGHDLKGPCISCDSSDAFRIHQDKGVAQCYSCSKAWSPFDLCKTVLRDHDAAKKVMVEVGLWEPEETYRNGNASTPDPDAVLADWAARKGPGITVAAWKAYGGRAANKNLVLPMYGPDGEACSTFRITEKDPKGRNEYGKSAGLFFPGRRPKTSERWLMVEGAKDAAALWALGYKNTVGLPTNQMNEKFAEFFRGVELTIVPDCDKPSHEGAGTTGRRLHGIATSVAVASLPAEIESSHGADVRDILQSFGDRGPDAIRKAIKEARPVETFQQGDGTAAPVEPVEWKTYTCVELMAATFDTTYLVEDMLVAGQPCILAGPKKTLKTSLLIDVALGVASGFLVLRKFVVPKAVPVGLMTGESGLATIQETIARIAAAEEIDTARLDNLIITDAVPLFGHAGHEAALGKLIGEHSLKVLIVDPAYMAIPGDEAGNLMIMGQRLRGPAEICQRAGCTLILAHHTRKNRMEPYGRPELEDIAWAGFQEFARQWILLNRRERYEPGSGSHRLWLSIGGSAGHGSLWGLDIEEGVAPARHWHVALLSGREVTEVSRAAKEDALARKQGERTDQDKTAICRALAKYPDGQTKRAIRDVCGIRTARFDAAFSELINEGAIVDGGEVVKANGRGYPSFRLADDNDSIDGNE